MTENNHDNQDVLKNITQEILGYLGYNAEVSVFSNEKDPNLKVISINSLDNLSALIGKNGQNIKSLEQIIRLLYFKKITEEQKPTVFMVDLNDYRRLKAKQVVEKALEVAHRVRISKKAEALVPMSSYERRLVHVELASYADLETESIGEEPKRRIVIKPLII